MNKTKLILAMLAILFGGFMIVFGGMDDSPGAQGIGLVLIVIGIVILIKSRRKSRN